MPAFDAPSISITSTDMSCVISRQFAQVLQGIPVGPCSQLSAFAKIRVIVVFPTPRVPEKNAWAMVLCGY